MSLALPMKIELLVRYSSHMKKLMRARATDARLLGQADDETNLELRSDS